MSKIFFCAVVIPSENTKLLEVRRSKDSENIRVYSVQEIWWDTIYDLCRSWIFDWSSNGCKTNSENSSTTKGGECISCEYSTPTIGTFDGLENNLDVYRGEDYMKSFCESIRERLMKIINSERKKIVPLTND